MQVEVAESKYTLILCLSNNYNSFLQGKVHR